MDTPEEKNLFRSTLNDQLVDEMRRGLSKLLERGYSPEEAQQKLENLVPEALKSAASPIVDQLKRDALHMILEHQAIRNEFEARLLHRWLEPLTLYEIVLVGAREAGSDFHKLHGEDVADDDFLFEALTLLHGRGCVTASEVYSLLRSGHPFGAHARWRTLHELSVVAALIGKAGQELAERYLLHQSIQEAKDANDYQKHCETLGYEPMTSEEMGALQSERQRQVDRFGDSFKNQYGWATILFDGREKPTFRDLEEKAGMDHMRPHYGLASHRVHAGAKGATLNVLTRGPTSFMLAGPTNWGLADPGHGALLSLFQVTSHFLLYGRPDLQAEPIRIVIIHALERLLDEAGDSFLKVHHQLQDEEEQLWRTPHEDDSE